MKLSVKLHYVAIVLFVVIEQIYSQVSGTSQENNDLDLISRLIPEELQDILTEDTAFYDIPEDIQKNLIYYLSGFDESNRPVWVVEGGKWDIRSMVEKGQEKDVERYLLQGIYRFFNSTQILSTEEEPVTEGVALVDLDDFQLKQITSAKTVNFLLEQYRKFLPVFDKLHAIYVVNANYAAEAAINLVRPVLGRAFEKIIVYGNNKAKWIPRILKNIPRDQLPEWYGGVKDFTPYEVYG